METKNKTAITKDMANKKIKVTRSFDATPEQVWSAWTDEEILDQWWAPKPWKAKTKSMDFHEGCKETKPSLKDLPPVPATIHLA